MSRKERNSGAAMVIVLCVMVVFLALSTTILLAGSVTLNTARNNIIYERGKIQAASLSELFARDMKKSIAEDTSTLVRYVRDQIIEKNWPAYSENSGDGEGAPGPVEGAVKTFTMDASEADGTESKHRIRIEMYWTSDQPVPSPIVEAELADRGVHLFVDVISTLNDSEYHVKREFELNTVTENPTGSGQYLWKWKTVGRSDDRE